MDHIYRPCQHDHDSDEFNHEDLNRVTLSGRVTRTPEMRLISPNTTEHILVPLLVRGLWPDHTGQVSPLRYEITCFEQGPAVEKFLWASAGDYVRIDGKIDFIVGEWDMTRHEIQCVLSIRIGEMCAARKEPVMYEENGDIPLPTHEEIESLGREIGTKMAGNQSEAWGRIFYAIGQDAPTFWGVCCIWLIESIARHSRVHVDYARWSVAVSNQEAHNLGFTGSKMSLDSCMVLASILYNLEQVLGLDHVAIVPVRWERWGALKRAHAIATSPIKEGEWNR